MAMDGNFDWAPQTYTVSHKNRTPKTGCHNFIKIGPL